MKRKVIVKVVVGIIVIVIAMGYIVFQAMQSSWSYYYLVDEFVKQKEIALKYSVRIAGRVQKGSVQRDLQGMSLTFILAGSDASVPISYRGIVPDNFDEGREVVVQGRLDKSSIFEAEKIITKCESKYKAKVK